MKTILCYGDSNTWGLDPSTRQRFAPDVRWTGVLAHELGAGYRVVEEGLKGRTTRWDDPIEPGRNGLAYLGPCLESHQPLDLVLLMLGTNDLRWRFGLSAADIAQCAAGLGAIAARTARTAHGDPAPVLLIAPPPIARLTDFDQMYEGAVEKSVQFARSFATMARFNALAFFDAGAVIRAGDLDGVHFDADEHAKLGRALAAEVRRLVG